MGELTVGAYTYGLPLTRRGNHNSITIGKFCSIAQDVIFDSGFSHKHSNISTYPFNPNFPGCGDLPLNLHLKGDIHIGNDVWIGEGAIIMSGVTIGDGVVIGARSIITKDIKPYEMVVGHHRVVGKRFEDVQIERLLAIKWWNWREEKIKENAHLLVSENIDEFINLHYDQSGTTPSNL